MYGTIEGLWGPFQGLYREHFEKHNQTASCGLKVLRSQVRGILQQALHYQGRYGGPLFRKIMEELPRPAEKKLPKHPKAVISLVRFGLKF